MILLLNADATRIPLADEVVHSCVTSPPYYGLRKYAVEHDAELGLEDTPELYLERMVAVFREVRRVLRSDGVCFINLGDSYFSNDQHAIAYGTSGKAPVNYPDHDCVSESLCDVCRVVYQSHKSHNDNPLAAMLTASLYVSTPAHKVIQLDRLPTLDSISQVDHNDIATQDQEHVVKTVIAFLRAARVSTSHEFYRQLRDACLQRVCSSLCLLCARLLPSGAHLCECKTVSPSAVHSCVCELQVIGDTQPDNSSTSLIDDALDFRILGRDVGLVSYPYYTTTPHHYKPLDLMNMPHRLAAALQADGWYHRSTIIWAKPNPMPESVRGWYFVRHRVTIEQYEKMQSLRRTKGRNKDRSSDMPRLSQGEISDSQTAVSEEREGTSNRESQGTATRSEGKEAAIQSISSREGEQKEIRSYGEGKENPSESGKEILDNRERDTEATRVRQAQGEYSATEIEAKGISSEISEIRERQSNSGQTRSEETRLVNEWGESINSSGMVGDQGTSQVPMLLLQEEDSNSDDGSRNSIEQRGETYQREYSSSMQTLQLKETRQDNTSVLIDCPGCPECAPHGGLVLRRGAWRPTTAHEYIFMLTKTDRYFADGDAVREPHNDKAGGIERFGTIGSKGGYKTSDRTLEGVVRSTAIAKPEQGRQYNPAGRNARSVWTFPTQAWSGAHFATYPEELPRRCLKASLSARGCCPRCGSPWARVVEKGFTDHTGDTKTAYPKGATANRLALLRQAARENGGEYQNTTTTLSWLPTCDCNAGDPVPQVVLDPFCGSGTTGLVARELGARFVGVDLSFSYLRDQARERLGLAALDAWTSGAANKDGRGELDDLPLFREIDHADH